MNPGKNVDDAFNRTLLLNNYFSKNRDKYTAFKDDDEKYKGILYYIVFDDLDDDFEENRIKL